MAVDIQIEKLIIEGRQLGLDWGQTSLRVTDGNLVFFIPNVRMERMLKTMKLVEILRKEMMRFSGQ